VILSTKYIVLINKEIVTHIIKNKNKRNALTRAME